MEISSIDRSFQSGDMAVAESRVQPNNVVQMPNTTENESGAKNQDLANISEKTLIKSIENANKIMINHNTRAAFSVHEKTKNVVVKIIDTDTNEVIKEFPPEKILDLVAKIWEMAGLFVDKRR